jgi:protocatechuate 3,4-dioxygenase beta subunit
MAAYSIEGLDRREIRMMSAALAGSGAVFPRKLAAADVVLRRTPDQILGPFYPLSELPQNPDLTRVSGRAGRAEGQVLNVIGRVLNLAGEPVRNAKIEVWQANDLAAGGVLAIGLSCFGVSPRRKIAPNRPGIREMSA